MSDSQDADRTRVEAVLRRIAADLSMITDRELELEEESVVAERTTARVAGEGSVHISFKLGFQRRDEARHGCLLVPLSDAIALACYMMMMADDEVAKRRGEATLDGLTKDALMEVGNFVAGAVDAAMRGIDPEGVRVRSAGCQGVRDGVRPAFPYAEGDELLVGRGRIMLHDFEPFEAVLMLPAAGVRAPQGA